MKVLLLIISLAIVNYAQAQSSLQRDLVEVISVALKENQLPAELMITKKPDMASWLNAPFVVIKSDKDKGLVRRDGDVVGSSHVWVFDTCFTCLGKYRILAELLDQCPRAPNSYHRRITVVSGKQKE